MAAKTLVKLKAICDKHDVEMDAWRDNLDGWVIDFIAPKGKVWNATDGWLSRYSHRTIRHAIWFLQSDLKEGFRKEA